MIINIYLVAKLSLFKVLSTLPLLHHGLIWTYPSPEPKSFIPGVEILRGIN